MRSACPVRRAAAGTIGAVSPDGIDPELAALADAYGVATWYEDTRRRRQAVSVDTVRAVLAAMGVHPGGGGAATRTALEFARDLRWRHTLAPATVLRRGQANPSVQAHLRPDTPVRAVLHLETGDTRTLEAPGPPSDERDVSGARLQRRALPLPGDLPLGYHRCVADLPGDRQASGLVVVAPPACPDPAELPPLWGWMLQLYALRSAHSWGVGDLGDLRRLAEHSAARDGAGFVLCNPLHAARMGPPAEASPYYPSSRRFTNPMYLRVTDLPEFDAAEGALRQRVERLAAAAEATNRSPRIDRDEAWDRKLTALQLLHTVPVDRERAAAFHAWRAERGAPLETFATFCALAERHPGPWQDWPAKLHDPAGPAVAVASDELAGRVSFHAWLQFCCDEQLGASQRAACDAGMPIGVIHDLAVGVDPGGADAWALQREVAGAVTVGAPPDDFNQRGQDWAQPPLRPDRLPVTGFAPFRQMLQTALRHSGGVRIDHVMGLFRLWWIPEGADPTHGTYVSYPADELLGILALEAHRAGAVVVGEDLGTVDPGIRRRLRAERIASSAVLWFARTEPDGDEPARLLRPEEYPEAALATATTHDLPRVHAWWQDRELELQAELGLLPASSSPQAERERKAAERAELLALLQDLGLVGADPDADELCDAVHAFIGRCRARLVAVAPEDAVGEERPQNVPGTTEAYPNWRLPVAEATPGGPRPLLLEELLAHPRVRRTIEALTQARQKAASAGSPAGGTSGADRP